MTARLIIGAALAAAIVIGGGAASAADKASQKFIKDAMQGNLAEILMGQLAQKNGQTEGVRNFGQMLQTDHSDANRQATEVANSLGVTPPTRPSKKQEADYDRMSKLSGEKFDSEFIKHMIADHKKDIREFEQEAKRNDAAATFAKDALPTLRKHLDTAQSLVPAATIGQGTKR